MWSDDRRLMNVLEYRRAPRTRQPGGWWLLDGHPLRRADQVDLARHVSRGRFGDSQAVPLAVMQGPFGVHGELSQPFRERSERRAVILSGGQLRRARRRLNATPGRSDSCTRWPQQRDAAPSRWGWPMAGRAGLSDAGGARETFRQMGDRLAGMGYVALIPDIYYRAGQWAPFNVATLFTDKQERARLSGLTSVLTNDHIMADAGAYAHFLLARPEVSGSAIGTTGYCLGGRMSLIAAGGLSRTIAAAASFHGGRLAVAGNPVKPSPVGEPRHRHGLCGRREGRRLVHRRPGRAAGTRAHRRRSRPHP